MTVFRRGSRAIRTAPGELGVLEQLEADGLDHRQPGSTGWVSHRCPNYHEHAHDDRNFSASSNLETGHWVCHGCGARGRWAGFHTSGTNGPAGNGEGDLPDIAPVEPFEPSPGPGTETYDYLDEAGAHVASIYMTRWVEFGPDDEERHRKQCVATHPRKDGAGTVNGWGSWWNVPLYRSPEVVEAVHRGDPVYVVEGEKDADRLWEEGAAATTNPFGAGKFSKVSNAHILTDAEVRVVADRDRPGLRHALDVRHRLEGVAASVEVLLPAVGGDVSDHLHNGGKLEELVPFDPDSVRPSGNVGVADGRTVEATAEGFVLLSDEDVTYEPPRWLWRDWVVGGNLNVIAGDGGCGKSHFMVGMAARLSGGDLPGDHQGEPASTIYLSAEDDLARLKGLYRAAGGVPGRLLHVLIPRDGYDDQPTLPADMPALRRAVERTGARLVVIDPGMSFFEVRDSHNDQAMRRSVFGPLARLAMDTGAAVVFVVHLNKNSAAQSFRQRINGAVGLTNAPRSVIGMARDPDERERSVVAHVKGNLTKTPTSLVFEFVETEMALDGQDTAVTRLKLAGTTGLSADDLVRPPARARETKADRVDQALLAALHAGPRPTEELRERLEAELGEPVSRQAIGDSRGRLGLAQWWEQQGGRRVSYTGRAGDEPPREDNAPREAGPT